MLKVGVYGTLKQNEGNHSLLSECSYLGHARVPGFRLYARGIPYAVEDKTNKDYDLFVEIYQCHTDEQLRRLDMLEGHPRFYERKPFRIGGFKEVWIYTYPKDGLLGRSELEEITDGNY